MRCLKLAFAFALLCCLAGCASGGLESLANGRDWYLQLDSLTGSSGMERPDEEVVLAFSPEGRVYGSSGLNRYFGAFHFDAGKAGILFGPLGVTRRAGKAMAYEQCYLIMLANARFYRFDKGSLVLLDNDGKALASFSSRERVPHGALAPRKTAAPSQK
ncbi:MAG: META domain-containing protein [Victivallaceae bacterium]|nr:META domain-containing protein [Victivallaceae bacterium]